MHDTSEDVHATFKVKRLNTDIHNPCYLVHLNDVNVLLDCCIDTSTMACFMPDHPLINSGCCDLPPLGKKPSHPGVVTMGDQVYLDARLKFCMMEEKQFNSVIWDTVDVILVSNVRSILGLPFIGTQTKFRGRILATEPVVKFGKILLEELGEALEQVSSAKPDISQIDVETKNFPPSLGQLLKEQKKVWQNVYGKQTVMDTLNRIQLVAYHEPVDIFGLLSIRGSSAGFGIGSCNWTLASETEKVAYISHTSLLYSHVLPFDDSHLNNCDILIVGTMNLLASAQLEKVVGEFRTIVVQTLARGGHVLVPTNPCGLLFDLLETAIHAKENFNGTLTHLFPSDRAETVPLAENGTGGSSGSIGGAGAGANNPGTVTGVSGPVTALDSLTNTEPASSTLVGGGSSLAGRVARCPVYTIAGQIQTSLAYANAYGEWLNPEKESLLYTADAPFPYQSLLRSGQLIAVRSLHETPLVKDLAGSSGRSVSPGLTRSTSPLLANHVVNMQRPMDTFSASGTGPTTVTTQSSSDSGLALFHSAARESQAGLSGGNWPGAPCLIFASHPSLRFGPAVHLLRALAFGGLRPGGRAAQNTQTPRHAVVLVESSDYVQRPTSGGNPFDTSAHYIHQLLAPYFPVSDTGCDYPIVSSPIGTPCCNLTESVTVFWLPMDARIGPDELPQLITRCCTPRLAICLPIEVAMRAPDRWSENAPYGVHVMAPGQPLTISLRSSRPRMHPVRLSASLVSHMRPVAVTTPNGSDDLAPANPSGTKRSAPSTAGTEPSVPLKRAVEESGVSGTPSATDAASRTYVALVDGVLVSRDGKYWLNDTQESTIPGSGGRPVIRTLRPSTPPGTARSRPAKVDTDRSATRDATRVYVSQTPRIDPHRLIKELTERGVTGAYLADACTASHMAHRFAMFDADRGPDSTQRDKDDFILFPNPNTAIRLSDHGSHILSMDDSTRTAIRDTILSCLQPLDTCVRSSS